MIRSVLAGGGAEADALMRAGELLRIDEPIQLGHLCRLQNVLDYQIAVKIEKVLLQLPVRKIHGHVLPCSRATATDAIVTSMSPRGRRSTTTSPARFPSRARATGD